MSHEFSKNEIIEAARYLKEQRLTPAHTGNVSVRISAVAGGQSKAPTKNAVAGGQSKAPAKSAVAVEQSSARTNGMFITPTGMPYDELTPDDIVFVSDAGNWSENGRAPSSEWQFHLAAYKANPHINALVHTHSNYATTLASAELEIPAFHYMVAIAGGDKIPLIPYSLFGSKDLSNSVATAFETYSACLMSHHGLLAGGQNLAKAIEQTEIIESLSQQYWAVRQLGEPKLLSKSQMQEVIEKFQTYGQQEET